MAPNTPVGRDGVGGHLFVALEDCGVLLQTEPIAAFARGQERLILASAIVLAVYVVLRLFTGMPVRSQLRAILRGGDEPTESGEYTGLLSYAAEHHAVQIGLYDGFRSKRPLPGGLPDNPDVQSEPHYYKAAYLVGTAAHVALVGAGLLAGSTLV